MKDSRNRPVNDDHHYGASISGQAASKGGAYGVSEAGSVLGGMVGPPIIGGIIGSVVGEKLGEKAIHKTKLNVIAGKVSQNVGEVVGQENVETLGEIALTAFGYGRQEECICCPCCPSSQILLFLYFFFFLFSIYRLVTGLSYSSHCVESNSTDIISFISSSFNLSVFHQGKNVSFSSASLDNTTREFFPCLFGFEYLVTGSAVWLFFLPFSLLTLFGNCWRQCCCCLCDPIVVCCTLSDLFKRCLCELHGVSVCLLIWYSMCIFQILWSILSLLWLIKIHFYYYYYYEHDEYINSYIDTLPPFGENGNLLKIILVSAGLDFLIAGSEIFHKIRLFVNKRKNNEMELQYVSSCSSPGITTNNPSVNF